MGGGDVLLKCTLRRDYLQGKCSKMLQRKSFTGRKKNLAIYPWGKDIREVGKYSRIFHSGELGLYSGVEEVESDGESTNFFL